MGPLLTNGIDPSLLRVIEKRGSEHDATPRRRRPPEKIDQEKNKIEGEQDPELPRHALDDLA